MIRRLFFLFISCFLYATSVHAQVDRFAQIGGKVSAVRKDLLITPRPVTITKRQLPSGHNPKASFHPMDWLDTPEELQEALQRKRTELAPFLKDLAPPRPSTRITQPLERFAYRVQQDEDLRNFHAVTQGAGNWQQIVLPHFGPPLGVADAFYRTPFNVSDHMIRKGAIFLVFKGVDYIAEVFVNGAYIGSHEGIFAPFEFDITAYVTEGENTLLIKVKNDYPMQGHVGDDGIKRDGDKLYAATGPGYDEPLLGWHHSPPAMGIYQPVTIEARSAIHLSDVYVRPLTPVDSAEVWIEVNNARLQEKIVAIRHAVYGQNFSDTVYRDSIYKPVTVVVPGVGDLAKPSDYQRKDLKMGRGVNFLRFRIGLPHARQWSPDSPWLYQLQLELLDSAGAILDSRVQQFGMRSFTQDTVSIPKGNFFLNGKLIKLRGANTMGAFQQTVMRKDFVQLVDDILLAKLTNMNFIRMTQLPVQTEIYDYCDRLGLLTQTDLPLFGVLRRNKWMEAVKQAGEMERLVRNHPCNVIVTYINERFPNAEGSPHRHLDTYQDFEKFFLAADQAVRLQNPDRVIKAGDGDYDPPSPGLPDNHCYNIWYNGHGLGLGELHKGYWLPVKPNWNYGCGEFGAEGLDAVNTMFRYYPQSWLADSTRDSTWSPARIAMSQTARFYPMWFNRQHSLTDWVETSQQYQAWAVRFVTEALRRDPRMVSFAIHLFIDAWPAGWMKTIMDVQRQPKKAWFAYQHALAPLAVQLRTDRYSFFSGETAAVEAWVVNDLQRIPPGLKLRYQWEMEGVVRQSNQVKATVPLNSSRYQGDISLKMPLVKQKTPLRLRLLLVNSNEQPLHETTVEIMLYPQLSTADQAVFVPEKQGSAQQLVRELKIKPVQTLAGMQTILLSGMEYYQNNKSRLDSFVENGGNLVFLNLSPGHYRLDDTDIEIRKTTMGSYYFVSPATGHSLVGQSQHNDFWLWYDDEKKMIAPILSSMIVAKGWEPVLSTGDVSWTAAQHSLMAAAERKKGKGTYRICQLQFQHKINGNPAAKGFALNLLRPDR